MHKPSTLEKDTQKNKNPPTYVLVETVGRAIPCFRHGTDYILNLTGRSSGVLCVI